MKQLHILALRMFIFYFIYTRKPSLQNASSSAVTRSRCSSLCSHPPQCKPTLWLGSTSQVVVVLSPATKSVAATCCMAVVRSHRASSFVWDDTPDTRWRRVYRQLLDVIIWQQPPLLTSEHTYVEVGLVRWRVADMLLNDVTLNQRLGLCAAVTFHEGE